MKIDWDDHLEPGWQQVGYAIMTVEASDLAAALNYRLDATLQGPDGTTHPLTAAANNVASPLRAAERLGVQQEVVARLKRLIRGQAIMLGALPTLGVGVPVWIDG